ncbi:MAG: hypothetical protein ACM3NN_10105 [Nitrospirota bacterium]|jgi:hypothetical protein
MKLAVEDIRLGNARAPRAAFGALAESLFAFSPSASQKVRDREGAIASTRGACAPQKFRAAARSAA